ncbi:ABC transporter permease [Sphaerimonospora thailandensis]|uniref:Uncharacterized protein n=1 Tax=Sphaerimonospora thailandensis TaxID=795644 RepID=A0A8J3R7U8_9ACTN|nr:ABC transporter permease [Sphaerimonospora thailandensis]GIH69381.1 hypothetical protein Mth01_16340 [Sphaerimonospora thailandensis]
MIRQRLVTGLSAFVPTKTMPEWPRRWVEIDPVTHLADAVRGLPSPPHASIVAHPVGAPVYSA